MSIADQARKGDVLVLNTESLLASKRAEARRAWLKDFIARAWPAAVLAPIVLFPDEVPAENARQTRIDAAELPETTLLTRFLSAYYAATWPLFAPPLTRQ